MSKNQGRAHMLVYSCIVL